MAGAGKPWRGSLAQSRCWIDFVRRRHVVAGPAFAVRPARPPARLTRTRRSRARRRMRTHWSCACEKAGVLRCEARAGRAPLRWGACTRLAHARYT
jgi:hypothetical protein